MHLNISLIMDPGSGEFLAELLSDPNLVRGWEHLLESRIRELSGLDINVLQIELRDLDDKPPKSDILQ